VRHRPVPIAAAVAAVCAVAADARAAGPWVDRHLTLPSGDWAFDFGLGVAHVPDDSTVGVNAEMAVGVARRIELGLRTGIRFGNLADRSLTADYYGRLFDRQTLDRRTVDGRAEGAEALANPEVRVRGALVRDEVVELALEGRLVVPFADGTDAGLLFGVPLALHLGRRVRLDTGAYVPVVFVPHDTRVAVNLPVDLWIQATGRFWLGPMTGLAFGTCHGCAPAPFPPAPTDSPFVSLGFGLGYEISHALDFKASFLFPRVSDDSRDFGAGAGIEVRIE